MKPKCARPLGRWVGTLLVGLVVGCAGEAPTATDAPRRLAAWEPIPPDRAVVDFAGDGPEVIAARRRLGSDGAQLYDVALANRTLDYGENRVVVATRAGRDGRPLGGGDELVAFDFTPEAIDRNFALLLKGAARASSAPVARRNRYGPYRFIAADYPGSSRCVYAWQEIEGGAGSGRDAAIQFRFCDPERTPAEIIDLFEGMVIDLGATSVLAGGLT